MAKAYCCNRCKNYFIIRFIRVVGYPPGGNGSVSLDLCPKCSAQLMEFMKNPKAVPVSDTLLKKENSEKGKET